MDRLHAARWCDAHRADACVAAAARVAIARTEAAARVWETPGAAGNADRARREKK
jgi:hypothetical protein